MDKEDCIQVLLSTLQTPHWRRSSSIADWDLRAILLKAGLLLTPEQEAALLADMRRRGLIAGRERRGDHRIVAMWGVKITPMGEDWLLQRALGGVGASRRPAPTRAELGPSENSAESDAPDSPVEAGVSASGEP